MKQSRIPRNVIILAFVALASGFGQDLITPVLPAFLVMIGASHAGIGIIDGLLQGVASFFRFVSGILSDKFHNRKWFVFAGYALSSVARPLLALANAFVLVVVVRSVDGAGKGMKDAPRDALVADSAEVSSQGRAFGFHRFVDTAGSVLGPLVAAGLLIILSPSLNTYRFIFSLASVPGAIALLLIYFGIKEPAASYRGTRATGHRFDWKFWFFVAGMTAAMLTKINDLLFLTRAHEVGIPSSLIPVLFAGFTLVYAVMSYPIGVWSDTTGKLPFIATGWFVLSMVEFGFAHASTVGAVLMLFAFYGLFFALTEGSGRAIIADLVAPEARGSAYAIYNTCIGAAVIIGGYWIGHLWDAVSPHYAFTIASYGSFFGFLILCAMLAVSKKSKKAHG